MSCTRPSAVACQPEQTFGRPWRIGWSLGRTVYAQVGDEPSKRDVLLGLMETEALARAVVDEHNRAVKT